MTNPLPLFLILFILILLTGLGIVIFVLIKKSQQLTHVNESLNKLRKSFDDLDEQAKLIVKTDLELNKTQEELDRRLNGLNALQKTSRLISTTLEEQEIFHRLDRSLIVDLGFEKNLILIYDEQRIFHSHVSLGFSKEDIQFILTNLSKETDLMAALSDGNTFSSITSPKQRQQNILRLFDAEHFVLTPILTQNGIIGIVFIGNRSNAFTMTEGDEEIIAILATQIGQALENARLFEEVFHSKQSLEFKVQDRTKQLASALEEVEKISSAKSTFISAVSHELRTPLTSIKGYASILIAGKLGDIPLKARQRLEKINIHSDNLVKLINNLLDISRIESGRVEMNMELCNITHIIENIHDLLTPQMKEKNIQWDVHIANNMPDILIDVSQIERVFINLVGNAIKFTPENGTISIRGSLSERHATYEVSDTGIGISETDVLRLFDEFYRVENEINQGVKGTGLGLPLAKKIVEAHNGKIWITSKLNRGTTFHFTLPLT